MIVKLKGRIENYSENYIDLDVTNVVYRIFMTDSNISALSEMSNEIEIFIYEIIKEDSRNFIGFNNQEEREVFCDLLSVQGVGSKMALNIMSNLSCEEIISSIKTEQISIFTKISGVGQKLAKRILNELKEKIQKKYDTTNLPISDEDHKAKDDLISCLVNLGYPQRVCEETAIQVITENNEKNLEKLIPKALKILTKPIKS